MLLQQIVDDLLDLGAELLVVDLRAGGRGDEEDDVGAVVAAEGGVGDDRPLRRLGCRVEPAALRQVAAEPESVEAEAAHDDDQYRNDGKAHPEDECADGSEHADSFRESLAEIVSVVPECLLRFERLGGCGLGGGLPVRADGRSLSGEVRAAAGTG